MNNLVLGLAVDYDLTDIKAFVKSFRQYNQTDSVVLFVGQTTSQGFKDFLNQHNVKSVTFESFRYSNTRMNNYRFIRYIEFLSDNLEFKNVFVTDTRDVVFQDNIFNWCSDNSLNLFLEDPGIALGECIYNRYWTESAYGSDIVSELKDNTILCAGTILGSREQVLELCNRIKIELDILKHTNNHSYQTVNVDQAILNKIVYKDKIDCTLFQNGDLVGTVGQSVTQERAKDIVTLAENKILLNGTAPAVIHQYDRHQALIDFVSNLY